LIENLPHQFPIKVNMLAMNKYSSFLIQAALLLSFNHGAVMATPNTTPGTINCTDLSKNRVIGFNILDESQNPVTQGVTNFAGSGPPFVIDLNNYVNCDLNVGAILDTPVPANCDINNIRCVRFYFGDVVRRDFVSPFTAYLEFNGTGLPIDRTPAPGVQTLKACPFADPNCLGRNRGCYEVQVDVKPCKYTPVPVPVPSPVCTCPIPAPP
jgi:hypothetical protein